MIWKQRNSVCFSNKRPNPNLDKVVTKLATDFLLCGAKQNRNIHMVVKQVRWEKPDMGWFKLNINGATNGSAGNATGGGLIRDDYGNWVMGFSRKIGRVDSFVAEIWALRDGLQLCRQLNIDAVVIELDAKSLVDVLNNSSYCNIVISPLLDDCKLLIDQFPQVCVEHTFREANKCADRLAKFGLAQSLVFPPLELIPLIEADSLGAYCNRLCPGSCSSS